VIIQALSWSIKLREKILSQYPNSNIVDIIIQRRQTTQEIETKESVTLIEISIQENCWSFKRTIERIKGFIRTSLRKTAHLIIYQSQIILNVLKYKTLTPQRQLLLTH
jgi:hypothetical protein